MIHKKKISIRKQEKKKVSISDHYSSRKTSRNAPLAPKRKKKLYNANTTANFYLNKKKTFRASGGVSINTGDSSSQDAVADATVLQKNRSADPLTSVPKEIHILKTIQVGELAKKMHLRPKELIGRLMKMGEMANITKNIDAEVAIVLAAEYGCRAKVVSLYDDTLVKNEEIDDPKNHEPRPPVVTVMGHVDHGKTSLLDSIRQSNVTAQEAGAITQHIGAYSVSYKNKKITFLDTPGHEAFTAMRARGAAVTDIVILVVAADDGIKQQTREAIDHAKAARVPVIIAVNKVDLPDIKKENIEKIKEELSKLDLTSEKWGGDTLICEVSAKSKQGIDDLLNAILLQTDLLALKANPKLHAQGTVIEARIDAGKGPVATILVQKGTLHRGDSFVSGVYSGRVRTMHDDRGKTIKLATPSTPVEITGIDGIPDAGDPIQIVADERYAREISSKRHQYAQQHSGTRGSATGNVQEWIKKHKELNIIIKADVQGSVEALKESLNNLSTDEVKVQVISGSVGGIFESDIKLAVASQAIIIAFQTRPTRQADDLAERSSVKILYSKIIYEVIKDIKQIMEGMLEPEEREEIIARAEVRKTFKISRLGVIAGLMITSGTANRKHQVRVIRDSIVIFTGTISSLRRVKNDVEEVREGFECGLSLKDYTNIREGDQIEFFVLRKISRKL